MACMHCCTTELGLQLTSWDAPGQSTVVPEYNHTPKKLRNPHFSAWSSCLPNGKCSRQFSFYKAPAILTKTRWQDPSPRKRQAFAMQWEVLEGKQAPAWACHIFLPTKTNPLSCLLKTSGKKVWRTIRRNHNQSLASATREAPMNHFFSCRVEEGVSIICMPQLSIPTKFYFQHHKETLNL